MYKFKKQIDMRKTLFSFIFCALVVISANAEVETGKCGDNATWSYNTETFELKIEGEYSTPNYKYSSYHNHAGSTAPWMPYSEQVKTVTICEGITFIGKYSFAGFTSLVTVNMPSTLNGFEASVFTGCTSLESIVVPGGYNTLCEGTFGDCSSLVNVTIEDGVEYIEDWAFSDCTSLKEIILPSSIKGVDYGAFDSCPLGTIICKSVDAPTIKSNTFTATSITVYIPEGSLASYTDKWGTEIFTFIESNEKTTAIVGVKNNDSNSKAVKVVKNGKVYIINNGVKYDVTGKVIED